MLGYVTIMARVVDDHDRIAIAAFCKSKFNKRYRNRVVCTFVSSDSTFRVISPLARRKTHLKKKKKRKKSEKETDANPTTIIIFTRRRIALQPATVFGLSLVSSTVFPPTLASFARYESINDRIVSVVRLLLSGELVEFR